MLETCERVGPIDRQIFVAKFNDHSFSGSGTVRIDQLRNSDDLGVVEAAGIELDACHHMAEIAQDSMGIFVAIDYDATVEHVYCALGAMVLGFHDCYGPFVEL